ncbi:MAG: bacterioferritin [Bdellovibrionales bacterium]|jgi:bacterioferritin|nr:bacterioferritin [Bdellovibrionales bacterium]
MKGNKEVLDSLNQLLTGELTSVNQYFIHSEMLKDWGLNKVYERFKHEMEEEQMHARKVIERILFLEGKPNMNKLEKVVLGKDIKEIYQHNLDYEMTIRKRLQSTIALAEKKNDYVTRDLLSSQLLFDTEEDHVYWLEIQLSLIKKIGIENYLQSQMG